jgi:PPM family protein phosphatase
LGGLIELRSMLPLTASHMPAAIVAIRVVPAAADQDRVAHKVTPDAEIVVLADGAGGIGGGREAAERVVSHGFGDMAGPEDCAAELSRLDQLVRDDAACGETTAVVVVACSGRVFGASVGDSGAWMLTTGAIFDLTQNQRRKPLLGSGSCEPVTFATSFFYDRVLVASDGLLKYAPRDRIHAAAFEPRIDRAADALVAAARLPNGALQDDLALVLLDPLEGKP